MTYCQVVRLCSARFLETQVEFLFLCCDWLLPSASVYFLPRKWRDCTVFPHEHTDYMCVIIPSYCCVSSRIKCWRRKPRLASALDALRNVQGPVESVTERSFSLPRLGPALGVLVSRAASADLDVKVVAVNDPFRAPDYMVSTDVESPARAGCFLVLSHRLNDQMSHEIVG